MLVGCSPFLASLAMLRHSLPQEKGSSAAPTTGSTLQFLPIQAKTQSVRDLTMGFTINTVELKRDTQELLKKVMHYNMDTNDQKLILGVKERLKSTASPTYSINEIPEDLAGLLDPKLQE
jgi:hypothetical protein